MDKEIIEFKEGDLVMIRVATGFGYSNTWWRVLFIDNNGTFEGKLERHYWYEYKECKKGDIVTLLCSDVKSVYTAGEQFCYSDNITICNCEGLCRDK